MYECDTCTRLFRTVRSCEQHMNDTDHWSCFPCETCSKTFRYEIDAEDHMLWNNHFAPLIECDSCSLQFKTQEDATRHMNWANHFRHRCDECDRTFQNQNNLRMHLNSKVHRGKQIRCPFCAGQYTTASGLSHHLETGSCSAAPQLNRETIFKIIRERDPKGILTNKLLEWKDEESVQYEANDRAWNGDAWECYICHGEFGTRRALNQHINSPKHKQKVYHCPNKRGGCQKQCISLAALFSHLESEQCAYMRFEKVQSHVAMVFTGRKMISI